MQYLNEKSSLWVEKYRPTTVEDVIAPANSQKLLKNIVAGGELPNMLFYGSAGIGKTSTARALVNDLRGEELYINGSLETSIDVIRDRVMQFAMTHSSFMSEGKKIVIIDECERLSSQGQDALKVVLEEAESNCRFIFCTNNMQKIISPLHSRCKKISFNYSKDQTKDIILQYFKRLQFVLKNEGVEFGTPEKTVLAEYIQQFFPDFRKMINEMQGYVQTHGKIDVGLLRVGSSEQIDDLIELLKKREFNKMRKLCTEIDPDQFYTTFYNEISKHAKAEAIPPVVLTLAEYGHKHVLTIDQEVNLVACCLELMTSLNGSWK
jgi:replication factor C small subunit